MLTKNFGIEIEMKSITRERAAKIAQSILGGQVVHRNSYDAWICIAPDGREWKFVKDVSINDRSDRQCEFTSPILNADEDMETLQTLVRTLRQKGAKTDHSCGIHIHLDGSVHNAHTIKNFINIMAAKNDLLYEALQIPTARYRWCKKMDASLVAKVNALKKPTLRKIEDIWYSDYYGSRDSHYHSSRYHFLNLHSYFNGHGTIELRGFNSTLHAGKIRAYVMLAQAINMQALTQKCASPKEVPNNSRKTRMKRWLERIGVTDEVVINHLTEALGRRRSVA